MLLIYSRTVPSTGLPIHCASLGLLSGLLLSPVSPEPLEISEGEISYDEILKELLPPHCLSRVSHYL
jgi:hypothetical protein